MDRPVELSEPINFIEPVVCQSAGWPGDTQPDAYFIMPARYMAEPAMCFITGLSGLA